ncbi:acyl-CoA--6-aminopenicillanic acid acyl-transferase [soil metagenome]
MLRKIGKIAAWFFGTVLVIVAGFLFYVYLFIEIDPPVPSSSAPAGEVVQIDSGLFKLGENWFRKSESGLYELYVEGEPFEIGVANGKLTKKLVQYQEVVFTNQITRLVPSNSYRNVLKYIVGWFNHSIDKYIPEEYDLEIYGISRSASHAYDTIATPYQRMLNYHAAHDIGHALQNISLVGCTSFATWGSRSEDSTLIIGRNFDLYLGDEFARDKIIAFYNPSQGHKFMMVTFGGMAGVLSGMNDQGLTVTINAAKSEIPLSSGTPVSLVAREMLQYASTIKEAYEIAAKRKMFVSESLLIGSAKDHRASIIEKTPDTMELFESTDDYIISTNHFQGNLLGNTKLNKDHMAKSASVYRYERVKELLDNDRKNSVAKTAAILRNQNGKGGQNIGNGNEKLINQLISHHGIIFQPEKKLVWVSAAPWQLGRFVCYDLNKIFSTQLIKNQEVYESDRMITEDPFLKTPEYSAYLKFLPYRFPFNPHQDLQPDSLISWNPDSYQAYLVAGDYYTDHGEFAKAINVYKTGLTKEVATEQERNHMKKNLQLCEKKIK